MKVRITKAWLVEVIDENDRAIRDDWSFGTRIEAEKLGKEMLESMKNDVVFSEEEKRELRTFLPEQEVNPTACIYWAMNSIGGAK